MIYLRALKDPPWIEDKPYFLKDRCGEWNGLDEYDFSNRLSNVKAAIIH